MKHVEIFCKIKSADIFLDGIGAYKIINKKGTIVKKEITITVFPFLKIKPIIVIKYPSFNNAKQNSISGYLAIKLLNNL